ncbi:MAG: hypothetical protein M0R73_05220 [Dehalococcoidia bacterium]|nr:hypothetical protein [Dehalococcoidia bacterium]
MSRHTPDEQWIESTEGDLDPDLAEEAPYSAWEPRTGSNWFPFIAKVVAGLLAVMLILSVVLPALT